MSAIQTERIVYYAQAARQAKHGEKGRIYEKACAELGMDISTLHAKIGKVAMKSPRKRREDAGQTALSREEAMIISGTLMASTRKNNKRLYSVEDAVVALRADGKIKAVGVDKSTGELRPLSISTIIRALRGYGLHPDQLLAPEPVTELRSLHPNHVWQIDASLCVLYYLKSDGKRNRGLQVMERDKFYKNKPKNLQSIEFDRVWSYEITEHSSSWIYAEYVLGAESGENLCNVLINAMQERGGADMLHGVPRILFMDPGSANTASMTKNLCKSLGIEMIAHKPGSARATGQVENARNIIERKFESGLSFFDVSSLEELNALAAKWRANFNATATHRRHGMTRSAAWMLIKQDQLIKAPSVEICRELAVSDPESRVVSPKLRVSFRGKEYDVSTVPGVMVQQKLLVTRNPWRMDAAQVVLTGEDGREVFHVVNEVQKDELGFSLGAATIGAEFKRHADTPAQTARKEIEQLVMGTTSQAETEAARKAKALPFGGTFNPYKYIDETELPTFMPRRGTEHDLAAPKIEFPPYSHVEAVKIIISRIGDRWIPSQHYPWITQRYPQGVPHDAIDPIVAELTGPQAGLRQPLRAVGGA